MVKHIELCTGKDEEMAAYFKEKANYYQMMSTFCLLRKEDQLIFMAMYDQMVDNAKQEGGSNE